MKTFNQAGHRKKAVLPILVSGLCFAMLLALGFRAAAERYTTVYTPNGTAVTGAILDEMSAKEIAEANDYQEKNFPYWQKRKRPWQL